MGLWLKCPGCHAKNPLYVQVCAGCGQSLDNLPLTKRVYVVGAGEAAAPPPPAPEPAAKSEPATAPAAPKGGKAKKPKKKKG
jgi:hypothetical protein